MYVCIVYKIFLKAMYIMHVLGSEPNDEKGLFVL